MRTISVKYYYYEIMQKSIANENLFLASEIKPLTSHLATKVKS